MSAEPLWSPDAARIAAHRLTRFMGSVNASRDMDMKTFDDVHRFSVREPGNFWSDVWDFCDVRSETRGDRVLIDREKVPGAQFFPDARLNFTQNLPIRKIAGIGPIDEAILQNVFNVSCVADLYLQRQIIFQVLNSERKTTHYLNHELIFVLSLYQFFGRKWMFAHPSSPHFPVIFMSNITINMMPPDFLINK